MKIGLSAIIERDMHALLATVQALTPDDLLLAISYSGERRELNLAAEETLRVGGQILAITGFTLMGFSSAPATACIPSRKNRPPAVRRSLQPTRK